MKHDYQKPIAQWLSFRVDAALMSDTSVPGLDYVGEGVDELDVLPINGKSTYTLD